MLEEINEKVREEMPKTEGVAKAKRKQFSAAEKLRILREVDGLAPQKRGPKPDPQAIEIARLKLENACRSVCSRRSSS